MAMNGGKNSINELTLGKKIQLARQEHGLTQQELCSRANLSYSTLTKIERGAIKAPSIFTIRAITEVLNIELDSLFINHHQKHYLTSSSGIEFIYFDVNGCLVKFYEHAFGLLANDFMISPDIIETFFWKYNDTCSRGDMTIDQFNQKLAEVLQTDSVDWSEYYLKAIQKVEPMQNLLLKVADNYHIGLLTNSMPGLLDKMFQLKIIPNIDYDVILDSSKINLIKPEKEIFELATQKAGLDRSKILLIDDTKSNLVVAQNIGWKVEWFDYTDPTSSVNLIEKTLF
jgi:HAD superfamily hydrolase (TIGR01509 family)